ncbi:MAG: hypothetical protein ACREJO_04435 [Phycisphaerales bacterium]
MPIQVLVSVAATVFLVVSLLLAMVALVRGGVLWKVRAVEARCGACGYAASAAQARCPECGGAVTEVGLSTPALRARHAAPTLVALGAWLAIFAAVCGGAFFYAPNLLGGSVLSREIRTNLQCFLTLAGDTKGGTRSNRPFFVGGELRAIEGQPPRLGVLTVSTAQQRAIVAARLEVDVPSGLCTLRDRFGAVLAKEAVLDKDLAAQFFKAEGAGGDAAHPRDVEDLIGVLRFVIEAPARQGTPGALNLQNWQSDSGGLSGQVNVWWMPTGTVYIRGLDDGWRAWLSHGLILGTVACIGLGGVWFVLRRRSRVLAIGMPQPAPEEVGKLK